MMVHGVDEDAVIETGSVEPIQQSPLVVNEILVISWFLLFRRWAEEKRETCSLSLYPSHETKAVHDLVNSFIEPLATRQEIIIESRLQDHIKKSITRHDLEEMSIIRATVLCFPQGRDVFHNSPLASKNAQGGSSANGLAQRAQIWYDAVSRLHATRSGTEAG